MSRPSPRKLVRPSFVLALLLVTVAALGGCGRGGDEGGSDPNKARQLVGSLADMTDNPKTMAALFVEGAAPNAQQCKEYGRYRLWARSAELAGNTATLTVEVKEKRTGKILPELTWTAVNEGGTWKLKNAPLP